MLSVHNLDDAPALAQVVIWTHCGLPVLDFTVFLAPGAVQPLNLRDVIAGRLPETGPDGGENPFPSCSDPIALPELDAAALAAIEARLTGRPDPASGLCWARPTGGATTGFVTVTS